MSKFADSLQKSIEDNFGDWLVQSQPEKSKRELEEWLWEFKNRMNNHIKTVIEVNTAYINEQYGASHVVGMNIPLFIRDTISVLYPEGHASRDKYISSLSNKKYHLLFKEYEQLKQKEEFSISGAMRWEFSQEAPIWGTMKINKTDSFPRKP